MQNKLTLFFWFHNDLKEVNNYYQNIFNRNGVVNFEEVSYTTIAGAPAPTSLATIKLFGTIYNFMGTKRPFDFNESVSLVITTEDQEETDYYWDAFTKEGKEVECGWCKDKYGISWQITPKKLMELIGNKDKDIATYASQQMMKMKKIIIKDLEKHE